MKLTLSTAITMSLLGHTAAFNIIPKGSARRVLTRQSIPTKLAKRNCFLATSNLYSKQAYSVSSTSMAMSKDDIKPFPTWTYDNPCETMEWTELAPTNLSVTDSSDCLDEADLIIIGVTSPPSEKDDKDDDKESKEKDETPPEPVLSAKVKELDDTLGGALAEIMVENYKTFKHGATVASLTPSARLVTPGSKVCPFVSYKPKSFNHITLSNFYLPFYFNQSKRYALLALGEEGKEFEDGDVTKIAEAIASETNNQKKVTNCAILLPKGGDSLSEFSTAFYSALYSDNRYRTGDKKTVLAEDLSTVNIIIDDAGASSAEAIESGKKLAMGTSLTKDIVNAPHNVLNSLGLANVARDIAAKSGGTIECKILDKDECEKRGMGSFLGVARGSETEPQFIHLTYKPKSGNIK